MNICINKLFICYQPYSFTKITLRNESLVIVSKLPGPILMLISFDQRVDPGVQKWHIAESWGQRYSISTSVLILCDITSWEHLDIQSLTGSLAVIKHHNILLILE